MNRLDRGSLTSLYKTPSVRDKVWRCLCPEFECKFEKLIQQGEVIESRIVERAKQNKFYLKELFIEFGFPMESLEDIKANLEFLKELERPPPCGDFVDHDDRINK